MPDALASPLPAFSFACGEVKIAADTEGALVAIIRSDNQDIYFNLAVEEYLLEHAETYAPALFLWRAGSSVVIGKNQNPWRECRTGRLARDGAALARRVSGGGAVYHDAGNVNFTLVLRRDTYDEKRQFKMVRRALNGLGVEASLERRNSLVVDGRKISGNAFCYRKQAAMHHGTLLVCADLRRLHRYLDPPAAQYTTRAIASVPAGVVNLEELRPGLNPETVSDALEQAFREDYDDQTPTLGPGDLDGGALDALKAHHATEDWLYRRTPPFTVMFDVPTSAGGPIQLGIEVVKGRVAGISVDGVSPWPVQVLNELLMDSPYDAAELSRRIEAAPGQFPDAGSLVDYFAADKFF